MLKVIYVLAVSIAVSACSPSPVEPVGTVIVNARVIDGTGGPSRSVSVRVVGDRIATVGDFEPQAADSVIDAAGLVLAPGFIDTHSHHGVGLGEMPEALALVNQGVTTVVVGQDGGQVYPLADFLAELDQSPGAVNVASFAGHGTIRSKVLGSDYKREATTAEVQQMAEILRQELAAGAVGLSTGLEYDPGSFSSTAELVTLATVAAGEGGMYLSHIRSEDQYFWEAIDEAITIGREASIPVRVAHVKLAMTRWWGQSERLLSTLDDARESGVDITLDVYPYRAWNSGFSWLITLFPKRDITRREGADYILNDMLSPEGIFLGTYTPNPEFNGMTIAEIAAATERDPATTLMDMLAAEAAHEGEGSSMLGFAMDEPDIEAIMAWPLTVLGSDGEMDGVHPRGYGAFTRYLGHYVRDRGVVSLEEGVRRVSSMPAEQVGIHGRGLIEEGRYADLVLFDPDTIIDRATPDAPHTTSVGIDKVWVNGELVFSDEAVTGNLPGMTIRRGDDR